MAPSSASNLALMSDDLGRSSRPSLDGSCHTTAQDHRGTLTDNATSPAPGASSRPKQGLPVPISAPSHLGFDAPQADLLDFRRPEDVLETLGHSFQFGAPVQVTPGQFTKRNINATKFSDGGHSSPSGQKEPSLELPGSVHPVQTFVSAPEHSRLAKLGTKPSASSGLTVPCTNGASSRASVLQGSRTTDGIFPETKRCNETSAPSPYRPFENLGRHAVTPGHPPTQNDLGPVQRKTPSVHGTPNGPPQPTDTAKQMSPVENTPLKPSRHRKAPSAVDDLEFAVSPKSTARSTAHSYRSRSRAELAEITRPFKDVPPAGREVKPSRRAASRSSYRSNITMKRSSRRTHLNEMSPQRRQLYGSVASTLHRGPKSRLLTRITQEFGNSHAQHWNDYVRKLHAETAEVVAELEAKVEKLEASVHEKARDVEARDLSIQKRNKAIQQLQEQKLILENETKMLSAKTEESGLRMGELKAKCNTFREKLNAAIKEQQELFIRSRKMCADTLQDMEAERESAELKAKSVEALREKMIGSLRSEIEQAKQEGQQLARTICDLRNRVGDKERELSREKDNIRDLVAKQEVQQELQASLATISAQNKTIVAKLDEQQARLQDQQTESSAQYAAQLAAVTEQLQELQTRILGQPEQWKQCFAPQEESLKGLESKVEGAMTSQAQAVKAISDGLRKDLASHMSEIWQHLEDQEKTLSQQIKDKSEENSSLGSLLAGRDEECEQLQIELEAVDAQTREQDEVIEALNDRIAELEASVSGPEVTAELHSLQTTADRLQQDLMDRETAIAELEQQLHEQEQARLADAHKFGVDMQKTLRLVQERESEKNQAVGAAKKELQVEMERVITEKHSKLDQMQEEKEMLATQLAKLEQAIKAKDNVERDSQALVHSLQAKLDEAEKQRAALARESEARSAEIRELRVHGSKAVSGLEAEMVATQEKASELAERVEQDKVKLDTIFHALERWAVKQGLTTEFGPALGNVREHGSPSEISSMLKKVLDSTLTAIIRARLDSGLAAGKSISRVQKLTRSLADRNAHGLEESSFDSKNALFPAWQSSDSQDRRVIVRSPADFSDVHSPPSIAEEQRRRREGMQPKSIIKTPTITTTATVEGAYCRFERTPHRLTVSGRPPSEFAVQGVVTAGRKRKIEEPGETETPERTSKSQNGVRESLRIAVHRRESSSAKGGEAQKDSSPSNSQQEMSHSPSADAQDNEALEGDANRARAKSIVQRYGSQGQAASQDERPAEKTSIAPHLHEHSQDAWLMAQAPQDLDEVAFMSGPEPQRRLRRIETIY